MEDLKKEFNKIKDSFEEQLENAISKNPIIITTPEGDLISMLLLAEPLGLYGADEADNYIPIKINQILQCCETGAVYAEVKKYGVTKFDFDVIGTKKEIKKLKDTYTLPKPNIRFI